MPEKAVYGGKSGKVTDDLLDTIAELVRNRDAARKIIHEFALADPALWPILSEIDNALLPPKQANR